MTVLKPLRELVSFKGGGTPSKQVPEYWDGDIPWASVKDFTSTSLSESQDFITQEGLRNSSANLIPKGHVIIPTRMSLGKAAINAVDLAINQDLRALIPKVPLDANFLLHAVLSLKEEIVKKGSGATVKGITQEELYKLEILVPQEFEDQIRIAHLLGKVEGLIAQRKQHLQQLDDLLESVFLEMFGDSDGWPLRPLSSVAADGKGTFSNGPFGSDLLTSELTDAGVPVIYIRDIRDARYERVSTVYVTEEKAQTLTACLVQPGDILVAKVGDPPGTTAVYPKGEPIAVVTQDVIRLRPNTKIVNSDFLASFLNSHIGRKLIRGITVEATRARFGLREFKIQEFPVPPMPLQIQFAAIAEKVEALKSLYQQSLTDLEALYGALSQKAFKGELDLSRVTLPAAAPIEGERPVAAAVPAPITAPVIKLPDTDLLLPALQDRTQLAPLLRLWLGAYRTQLGSAAFSLERFTAAAQARLAERHPDNDFEWAASDYESIKDWVFEALVAGTLTQGFDDDGNRIELKVVAEQGQA